VEFDRHGFVDSSLEGLAAMDGPDVHMFYITALGSDVFQDSKYWADNPAWTNLEFVKKQDRSTTLARCTHLPVQARQNYSLTRWLKC
jgi:hypothetical protein